MLFYSCYFHIIFDYLIYTICVFLLLLLYVEYLLTFYEYPGRLSGKRLCSIVLKYSQGGSHFPLFTSCGY